ncbi:MAG TPA: CYTH and CHAD domain-containing protein [Micropepsaceae bacterium]|nr:CYTH and CHAD domain-containing protein [Micropepsaceae bacterium]
MPQEFEIRFAAQPDDLTRLARGTALTGVSAGRPKMRRMITTYYDTPKLGFAKAGLSLRVRKTGGVYVQTVKTQSASTLADARGEYEASLPSPKPDLRFVPDPALRQRLSQIASASRLTPVIETQIRRTTRALKTETGDEIELAVDRGEIRTLDNGRAVLPVSELELELKQGKPLALYDVARKLSRKTKLTLAVESKAERGLRALQGEDVSAHKAGRIEFEPECTSEQAFAATLMHCLRHIARNAPAVIDARDPEGVHQIRVGLRRLRAALSSFGREFESRQLEELRARAKTLADVLGHTRELDVFATELLTPVEKESELPALAELRMIVEELRRESWNATVALVRSDEFTGFALDLAAVVEAQSWRDQADEKKLAALTKPARQVACETLNRTFKKACKRAKRLSSLDTEERHRLRIALKELRYSAEFFASLFPPKTVSEFLERLSKLQDLFGTINDAASVKAILRRVSEHAGNRVSLELSAASAFVEGWHQSRVEPTWDKTKKRWKRFSKTDAFWTA